jgi:SAM-dependent methyltransferase
VEKVMPEKKDWNVRYVQSDTPWDTGRPSPELQRVLAEWEIRPCRVLEMGCGTGDNAIYLAQQGFEVSAFDVAPLAIEQARAKARDAGVDIAFHVADFAQLPDLNAPFPFVFDRGFYHIARQVDLGAFQQLVQAVTQPGSLWLTLAGNANDTATVEGGPPRVQAAEICEELEPIFALVQLREFRFDANIKGDPTRPLAWSGLLRRR